MYVSFRDGTIQAVDELPDLSNLHPFSGLRYCDGEEILQDGHKSLIWKKCELFSDDEVKKISDAAIIIERLFENLNRLDAARGAYKEFKTDLESLYSNDQFAIASVDRRFRAYVFEWKLFLDHWKKYIDDGAQTLFWKDKGGAEKYIRAYQKLYKDVTTEKYDNSDQYVLATAIRNHVVHANNAVYASSIGQGKNKVYLSRDKLLSESKISASQRDVIAKQDELIDLSDVAEKSLEAAETIMEELLYFQIDQDNSEAALTLVKANDRIVSAGIQSDRWMIFKPEKVHWEQSLTQSITLFRVKDEAGNSVDDPKITMPLMTPAVEMKYQFLNWQGYTAFAGYLNHLYETGKWMETQNKYLN